MQNLIIRMFGIVLTLVFFSGQCVAGEADYIIAVASDSKETTDMISTVGARAQYFLVFDQDGNLLETLANPHAGVPGGAGPRTAKFLADKQINVVIAGGFGIKMSSALKAADIKNIEKQGIIIDVVQGVLHAK